jgi:hypothetical protein
MSDRCVIDDVLSRFQRATQNVIDLTMSLDDEDVRRTRVDESRVAYPPRSPFRSPSVDARRSRNNPRALKHRQIRIAMPMPVGSDGAAGIPRRPSIRNSVVSRRPIGAIRAQPDRPPVVASRRQAVGCVNSICVEWRRCRLCSERCRALCLLHRCTPQEIYAAQFL